MCIDFQSIIFIFILFKLGQIFQWPPRRAMHLYQRCYTSLLTGLLMVNREIMKGCLFLSPSRLLKHHRTINLSLFYCYDADGENKNTGQDHVNSLFMYHRSLYRKTRPGCIMGNVGASVFVAGPAPETDR